MLFDIDDIPDKASFDKLQILCFYFYTVKFLVFTLLNRMSEGIMGVR